MQERVYKGTQAKWAYNYLVHEGSSYGERMPQFSVEAPHPDPSHPSYERRAMIVEVAPPWYAFWRKREDPSVRLESVVTQLNGDQLNVTASTGVFGMIDRELRELAQIPQSQQQKNIRLV